METVPAHDTLRSYGHLASLIQGDEKLKIHLSTCRMRIAYLGATYREKLPPAIMRHVSNIIEGSMPDIECRILGWVQWSDIVRFATTDKEKMRY